MNFANGVISPSLEAVSTAAKYFFRRSCRQYLWRTLASGTLPAQLSFSDVGTWWGAGGREIDVVALDNMGKVALVGSCKWTNALVDVSEYPALITSMTAAASDLGLNSANMGTENDPWLLLFSRSGFTDRLRELADAHDHLLLITLADMYR